MLHLKFQLFPRENIAAATLYKLVVTTQIGLSSTVDGIRFPNAAGVYRVDLGVSLTAPVSTPTYWSSLYVDVMGNAWSILDVRSYITWQNQVNYLDIRLDPNTNIAATLQSIVIELPTKSNDGIALFSDGMHSTLNYADFTQLSYQILAGVELSSMKCHFMRGYQTNGNPCKIICSQFGAAVSGINRFMLKITNPDISVAGTTLSIPLVIYSQNANSKAKSNYNVATEGIYVIDSTLQPAVIDGSAIIPTPSSTAYGALNVDLAFTG